MIGRGVIRNPWLFRQIRQRQRGADPGAAHRPPGAGLHRGTLGSANHAGARESAQVQRLKKFMNFIGEGLEPPEPFLHDIRRVATRADFFRVCATFWTTTARCAWNRRRQTDSPAQETAACQSPS